jgi:N-acetylneuraminic acid mutarotase
MIGLNLCQLRKRMILGLLAIGLLRCAAFAQSHTWAATGSMKDTREDQTATLLQTSRVLVAGGFDGSNHLSTAELYDPTTGKWSATGSMNIARDGHTTTLLQNGQVLVAGGFNTSSNGSFNYLSSAELYNPATGTWTVTGSMSTAREAHTATLLPNGEVLVAGGEAFINGSPVVFSSAELYNPSTGTWTKAGSMSIAREMHTATLLSNGQVLVAGGYHFDPGMNDSIASAELFNPAKGNWSATGSLNTARYGHAAVQLISGQVLVLDGVDQSAGGTFNLNSTELYNPAAGTWTVNGNTFKFGDSGFSVTLLATGKVLLAGGIVGVYPNERVTGAAELYDPSVGASVSTGAMTIPRHAHSATLLPNRKVLAAGGQTEDSKGKFTVVASAELYTP